MNCAGCAWLRAVLASLAASTGPAGGGAGWGPPRAVREQQQGAFAMRRIYPIMLDLVRTLMPCVSGKKAAKAANRARATVESLG